MAQTAIKFEKILDALPATLTPNTHYFLKDTLSGIVTIYISDVLGQALTQVSGKVPSYNDLTDKPTIASSASDLGLGNVDNTSDADKPVSAAQQTALDLKADKTALDAKAPLASPAFTGTVTGITKSMVELSNVDNTSDANKPISTAAQTALDAKADLVSGKVPASQLPDTIVGQLLYQGTYDMATALPIASSANKGWYYIASNATEANGYVTGDWAVSNGVTWDKVDNTDAVQSVAGRTGAIMLTKTDVGLGNVDNTSDANKPISTATQTALDTKADTSALDAKADKTALDAKADKTVLDTKAPTDSPVFTGTPTAPTATAGTNTTQIATTEYVASAVATLSSTISITKASIGLGNVDNTADVDKPISSDTQTALDLKADKTVVDLKAPLASPAFTGTVAGITKSMVGLNNVDNTADANKPISSAQQTALDSKADLVSGKVPASQLPDVVVGQLLYQGTYDMATALPSASSANKGWYYIASNATEANGYITGDWAVSNGTSWDKIDNTDAVQSVAGRTGAVVLTKTDVSLGNIDNTSDADKPVSTATQTALDLKADKTTLDTKAPLASPALTGTPTAPTATAGTNTTQIATTEYVVNAISGLSTGGGTGTVTKADIGLGNVDNTSDADKPISTVTQAALDTKAPLASPAFTGTPVAPTAVSGTNTAQVATTAFIANAVSDRAPINSPSFTGTVTGITKEMIGLGDVDNTTDANKPISIATQTALDSKADLVAGKVPASQLPDTVVGQLEYQGTYDMATALPAASSSNKGWYYIASNIAIANGYIMGDWAVSNGTSWDKIDNTDAVQSVAGRIGSIILTQTDVGLSNVDNTSDINKPISAATQTALDTKVGAASPAFTGIPTAPTAAAGVSTTQVATTAFVSNNPIITGLKETGVALAANAIDLSLGNYFSKTISSLTTLTVNNIPASGTVASFILDLTNGGAFIVTWWTGVKWAGGTAPVLTASGRDVLGFFTSDNGATWTGILMSKDVK